MATIAKVEAFRLYPRWLVVRVEASDGTVGWGEATLEGHIEAVEGSLQDLTERFLGHSCNDIERIWQSAHRQRFYRSGPVLLSALSGLDIALWDLKAKRFGVPLHQLLGGKLRDRVKVYTHVQGDTPKALGEAAARRREQGFHCVKTAPTDGLDWVDSPAKLERGVERLKAIKAAGLDGALDFHGRIHKPMARKLAQMLEPHSPFFIEEPLLPGHVEGIQQVAQHTTTPIALGERLYSRWDFKEYFEKACVDIIQPDLAHAGGISECMKIAHMAEAYDIAIAPHCPLGPVAFAACVQVDIACANFIIQEMIMPHADTADKYHLFTYLKNPEVFRICDGYIDNPTGNGLGIELDEDLIRKVDAEIRQSGVSWRNPKFTGEDNAIQEW
jgi:galactonate dehydratase